MKLVIRFMVFNAHFFNRGTIFLRHMSTELKLDLKHNHVRLLPSSTSNQRVSSPFHNIKVYTYWRSRASV